jgi:hypothetical protein
LPITEFRKYKVSDSAVITDFYSLLRVAILGAIAEGHLEMFINEQILSSIMGQDACCQLEAVGNK